MRVRRVPGAYEALLKYDRYFIPEPERFAFWDKNKTGLGPVMMEILPGLL